MESRKKGIIVIVVMAAAVALSFSAGNFRTAGTTSFSAERFLGENEIKSFKHDYVAVLHIVGTIEKAGQTYNQEWMLSTIDFLKNDKKNRGILLYIDSPGGTVYESDETYLALVDYKNETGKPVYAYFGSLAASGGYYIASAADQIFANRNTLTGSIGVIAGQSIDATELMEKIGIKSRTFTAGRNKNMMNYNSPLTEEQAQIMQSVADDAYEQFTSIVATARHMNIDDVKKIADGRIYTANQALKNGLIDEICRFEEAEDAVLADLDGDFEFEDFIYEYEMTMNDIFRFVSALVKPPSAQIKLNYIAN